MPTGIYQHKPHSKEARLTMSRNSFWLGKKLPYEIKVKLSESKKGQLAWNKDKTGIYSEETRKRMSEAHRGEKHYLFGKKLPDATKQKLSLALKGRIHSEESKRKMRESRFEYIKDRYDISFPNIGRNEKSILDNLEQELGCKIMRQFKISGYFLDGYIPETRLAIEVDERPKNRDNDIEREKVIVDQLGCKFLRIKDYV